MRLYNHIRFYFSALLLWALLQGCTQGVFVFEGLEGPSEPAVMMEPDFLGPEQFDDGSPSRLAVLITEDESHWLALAAGLKTIGIPFRMTRNVDAALTHDLVMIYPQATGLNLSGAELGRLREYAEQGEP